MSFLAIQKSPRFFLKITMGSYSGLVSSAENIPCVANGTKCVPTLSELIESTISYMRCSQILLAQRKI